MAACFNVLFLNKNYKNLYYAPNSHLCKSAIHISDCISVLKGQKFKVTAKTN